VKLGDVVRVRIVHDSELPTATLGRFRVSLTTQVEPFKLSRSTRGCGRCWQSRGSSGRAANAGFAPAPRRRTRPPAYDRDRLFQRWRAIARS
jgi:hypothetical protein